MDELHRDEREEEKVEEGRRRKSGGLRHGMCGGEKKHLKWTGE